MTLSTSVGVIKSADAMATPHSNSTPVESCNPLDLSLDRYLTYLENPKDTGLSKDYESDRIKRLYKAEVRPIR